MIYNVTHEFTRPADTTAYAANDLVANSTVAADVVIPNWGLSHIRGGFRIIGARLVKSGPVVTNAQFRMFLFGSDPGPLTNGDNASVFYETSGKDYVDTIDFNLTGAFQHATTWAGVRTAVAHEGIGFQVPAGANPKLYGVLFATAAYTPYNSEVFRITLELAKD